MDSSSTSVFIFHVFFMFAMLNGLAFCKECTNIPTELSSTTRLRNEMFSHYHLTPTDTSSWAGLLPRKVSKQEDEASWMMLFRKIKIRDNADVAAGFLKEFPLDDVRLDPESRHGLAQQTKLEYLLLLDVDSLVWSFRKTAALQTLGEAYGGWEGPDCELRRHFFGHYLSASAQMWVSTHNSTLREKMSVLKYSIEQHYRSLNEETGGMNDVLYNLYSITGDPKHVLLAHLFDKPCFLGLLAVQADDLSGFQANTHIPLVVGSQRRYEVTGDPLYKEIGNFFMNVVNTSHSYTTGGASVSEFWSEPRRSASTLQTENEESCTTYNMLKVSRHLYKWTKEVAYVDYCQYFQVSMDGAPSLMTSGAAMEQESSRSQNWEIQYTLKRREKFQGFTSFNAYQAQSIETPGRFLLFRK
ncbi:hypothetical protein ACET3Z_001729 [Daucus carota]